MNLKRTVAASAVALVSMGGAGIAIAQTNSDDPIRPAVVEDTVGSSTTLAQSDSATGPDDTLVPAPDTDPTTTFPNGSGRDHLEDRPGSSEGQTGIDDDSDSLDSDDFDDTDDDFGDDDDQGEDHDDSVDIDDDDSFDDSSTTVTTAVDSDIDDDDRYDDDSIDDDSRESDSSVHTSRR
jgi:hypothetical protein